MCLRCAGVGHVAAKCKRVYRRSPKRKRVHVRSKHSEESVEVGVQPSGSRRSPDPRSFMASQAVLSLPLTPEIAAVREELALAVVVSILSGYVTDAGMEEVLPDILNCSLAGLLTPLNDNMYLVPLSSRAKVKMTCKEEVVQFSTKDGVCSARVVPWSAEIGAVNRASGEGIWVSIWNLPLYGWCWSVILEVLKNVGELVALSQEFKTNKRFVSALVHRRLGTSLPIVLELSLGMRQYQVLLTNDNGKQMTYRADIGRFVLTERREGVDPSLQVR